MDKAEAGRLLASLRPQRELRCTVCGKVFTGVGRRQYCSRSCKLRAYYVRRHPDATSRKAVGAEPPGGETPS